MTPERQIVSELTYRSYRWNRLQSPSTTPEEWKAIFGEAVDAMERRYQQEERVA